MALTFSPASSLVTGPFPQGSGLAALTIACRVKLDAAALGRDQTLIIRGNQFSGTSANLILWRDYQGSAFGRNQTLAALLRTDGGVLRAESAAGSMNNTDWRHVAFVFEANQPDGMRFFLDGQADPNTVSTLGVTATETSSQDLRIAESFQGKEFVGSLADVACYKAALSDGEIALLSEGVSPLVLRRSADDLLIYQDLIARPNSPGVGPPVTEQGANVVTRHPRSWLSPGVWHAARGAREQRRFVIARAEVSVAGREAGCCTHAGFDFTKSNVAGEVVG